jgi:hypothetical protein
MRNTIVKSLVAGSLVVGSSLYGFTPTKIDYILYDYSKKIEWCKSHPNQYNTPVAQRVAKLERERDRKIKAITDAQRAKKVRVEKARASKAKIEAIELVSLRRKAKTLTKKLANASKRYIKSLSCDANISAMGDFTRGCKAFDKNVKVERIGDELKCYVYIDDYIKTLKATEAKIDKENKELAKKIKDIEKEMAEAKAKAEKAKAEKAKAEKEAHAVETAEEERDRARNSVQGGAR